MYYDIVILTFQYKKPQYSPTIQYKNERIFATFQYHAHRGGEMAGVKGDRTAGNGGAGAMAAAR